MKKSMDMFGQALYDRYQGKSYPLFFEVKGEKHEKNLDRYFRPIKALSKVEKRLISMCQGNILDVGCGTGNYIPAVEKMGKVIGIDISPKVIEAAKAIGRKNCFVGDVFSFDKGKRFDTITMLENNLGMGGTIEGTKKLLGKLSTLLKDTGKILIILSGRSKDKDFLAIRLTPVYRGVRGGSFKWINFNAKYLSKLCQEVGMKLKILSANRYYSFIKITKDNLFKN